MLARMILSSESIVFGLFPGSSKLLSITRSFGFSNGNNEAEIRNKLEAYLVSEIKKLGGLGSIFAQFDSGFADREYSRFEALLADSKNTRGKTSGGMEYAFSNAEIAVIKQNIKQFYQALQKELMTTEVDVLTGNKDGAKMKAGELSEIVANYLLEREGNILFASTKVPLVVKKVSGGGDSWTVGDSYPEDAPISGGGSSVTTYQLPQFVYDYPVRMKAASILRADRSEQLGWGYKQRSVLAAKYADLLGSSFAPILGMTADTNSELKKYAGAPMPLLQWLMDVLSIKSVL